MTELQGKIVLITGATRGQGRAEVDVFVAAGCSVIATDIDGESTVDLPPGVIYQKLDVSLREDWERAAALVQGRYGRIDVLVNNAGIWHFAPLLETPDDVFEKLYRINQLGVFLGLSVFGAVMKTQGEGAIINVASGGAWRGLPGGSAYGATKWAVRGLSRSAALEFARFGVRVNAVLPGVIETEMITATPEASLAAIIRSTPLRRTGKPEEVARVVAFLASDSSSFMTGAELAVDGGGSA